MPASRGHKRRSARSGLTSSSSSSRARAGGRSKAKNDTQGYLKSHKRTAGLILALIVLLAIAAVRWSLPVLQERSLRGMSLDQLEQLSTSQPGNDRAHYYLGVKLRDAGQLPQARDAFRQASQDNPDDEQAWLAWASAAQSLGANGDAFSVLSRFITVHPNSANAHMALSRFYSDHWAFDLAYQEASTAARLDPKNVDAWLLLGGRDMDMGYLPKAVTAFRNAVKLEPNDWHNLLSLAFALQTAKRNDEALVYYKKAYALAPNEPGVMIALGGMLLASTNTPGNQQQALQLLQRAVSMDPSSPPGLRLLGQAYLQNGEYQQAKQTLERAAESSPQDATVHFQLQQAYLRLGDTAAAASEAKKHKQMVAFLTGQQRLQDQMYVSPNDLALGLKYARFCASNKDYLDAALEYRRLLSAHPDAKNIQREFAALVKKLPQNGAVQ